MVHAGSRSLLPPRGCTGPGSADPSWHHSPPSGIPGAPSRSMLNTARPPSTIVSLTGPSIFLAHEVSDTQPNRVCLDLAVVSSNQPLGQSVEPGFSAFALTILHLTHVLGIFLRRSCKKFYSPSLALCCEPQSLLRFSNAPVLHRWTIFPPFPRSTVLQTRGPRRVYLVVSRLDCFCIKARSSRYSGLIFTQAPANFKFGFSALLGFVEAGPGAARGLNGIWGSAVVILEKRIREEHLDVCSSEVDR